MAQIDIQLSPQTLQALRAGGYSLYAFKGLQTNLVGPAPLVWYRTESFSTTTTVAWEESYQVFISHTPIQPGQVVAPAATLDVRLGLAVSISQSGGLEISGGGDSGGLDIFNYAFETWDVGVSQVVGGGLGPMFALPVYSQQMQAVTPIDRVLLVLAETALEPGAVVLQAPGPGVFIDFTGGEAQQTVEFDINSGWNWGGGAWAQAVRPESNLAALLVQQ